MPIYELTEFGLSLMTQMTVKPKAADELNNELDIIRTEVTVMQRRIAEQQKEIENLRKHGKQKKCF